VRRPTVPGDDLLVSLFQWLDTEEGMTSMRALDEVAVALEGVDLDVEKRRIVWPDGKRLTIDQTARRIRNKTATDLRVVETHLMCWMAMRFEPKGLDRKQMEAFEFRINQWVEDHKREQGKP
jgi:hypothetical protein